MKYKYILLDWDGCLAKTLDLWLEAYKKRNVEYGLELDDLQTVRDFFGTDIEGPKMHKLDPDEYYDKLLNEIKAGLSTVYLEEGVRETLQELKKRGHVLAVVSTNNRSVLISALKYNKIYDLISTVVAYEDTEKHKPNPEPLLKAMEEIRAEVGKTVMIGDSDKDVLAARSADIDSILFYPEGNAKYYKEEDLRKLKANYFVRRFEKILEVV